MQNLCFVHTFRCRIACSLPIGAFYLLFFVLVGWEMLKVYSYYTATIPCARFFRAMSKWRGNTRHMRNGVKMPSQTSVLTSSLSCRWPKCQMHGMTMTDMANRKFWKVVHGLFMWFIDFVVSTCVYELYESKVAWQQEQMRKFQSQK